MSETDTQVRLKELAEAQLLQQTRIEDLERRMEQSRPKKHPKRPATAYNLYCKAERTKIMTENPEITNREIFKETAVRWKDMDAREKAKFEYLAQGDKRRYSEELENQPAKTAKKKRKRDPDAPKPPVSAYIFFSKAVREEVKGGNPDFDQKQVLSRIGEMWSAMDDRQRAKYVNDAAQDKVRYENEKADYTRVRTLREHYDKMQEKRSAAFAALADMLATGKITADQYNGMLSLVE